MYKDMIKEAQKMGKANEDTMWKSIDHIDELLEKLCEDHPEAYQKFIRQEHENLYGPHFDHHFAEKTIEGISYTDSDNMKKSGAHWTAEQVEAAWARRHFKPDVTKWDKWVAANAIYADLCRELDENQILAAAYLFFFADEDYPRPGKVWEYFAHM